MAALLLHQILPVSSVVAPGHPGAALRDVCNASRIQGTSVRSIPDGARQPVPTVQLVSAERQPETGQPG